MNDSHGLCLWFTGLSAAGKTTLCRAVEPELRARSYRVRLLDAEELRHTVSRDLGFTRADRDENVGGLPERPPKIIEKD